MMVVAPEAWGKEPDDLQNETASRSFPPFLSVFLLADSPQNLIEKIHKKA
jgi:hypothetical protein